MSVSKLPAIASRRAQRGVILFIALIVLVAMSLAGIALMRSVDTNVMIAGNLAFRQGATLAADRAFEDPDPAKGAIAWLRNPNNTPLLMADQSVPYYWANWQSGVNLLSEAFWANANANAWKDLGNDSNGNRVRYVIHRMCQLAGDQNAPNANCVRVASAATTASTKGAVGYGQQALLGATSTYYRVTVRIDGPRNTVSYVQAMLN
jgi:type IV pilus assembly protein PilX